KTLEQKEQSLTDKSKHIDEREKKVAKLEEEKTLELEKVASLSQEEAREQILVDTRDRLSHEVASRIKEAEREIKERSD
ncbi:Rnase Y domain-containing protein, partial [Streptococcus pyogenes]